MTRKTQAELKFSLFVLAWCCAMLASVPPLWEQGKRDNI